MVRVQRYIEKKVEELMAKYPEFDKAATRLRHVLGHGVDEVYRTLYAFRFTEPEQVLQLVETCSDQSNFPYKRRRLTDEEYDRIGLDVMRRARRMSD